MKTLRKILFSITLLFIIFTISFIIEFIILFPWSPNSLVIVEPPRKSDLIVVLGGGIENRFIKAFNLAKSGYSNQIFCPTIRFPKNNPLISQLKTENPGIEFITGAGSDSTFKDAQITKTYIKNKNIHRIILVTSDFHSYRALWIFKKVLSTTGIISVPAETSYSKEFLNGKSKKHWAYRSEQLKFLYYYFRYWFI